MNSAATAIASIELITKLIGSLPAALQWLSDQDRELIAIEGEPGGIQAGLEHHIRYVEGWSSQITLKDSPTSRDMESVFVAPDYALGREAVDFDHILMSGRHTVILGGPGAGKTTAIKMLCRSLLLTEGPDDHAFPLLVRMRDLKYSDTPLMDHILAVLNIRIVLREREHIEWSQLEQVGIVAKVKERAVLDALDTLKPLVLLDGLDELPPNIGDRVRDELDKLATQVSVKIVVTCRTGALNVALSSSEVLKTLPFDDNQIERFCAQWFRDESVCTQFLSAVRATPYHDTLWRPLNLANLCLIYEAYGELPDTPIVIYQRIVAILIEEWDRQRGVRRGSSYSRFGPEQKRTFLAALAFQLATRSIGTVFTRQNLNIAYRNVARRFGLSLDEQAGVLDEVESHTGLLVASGLDSYEFSHKTIQEYLCGEHISRMPNLEGLGTDLILIPNECALATALCTDPSEFFCFLAENLIADPAKDYAFWSQYITRLTFERVQFGPANRFGFAYLKVASSLCRTGASDARYARELSTALQEFSTGSAVHESLLRIVHQLRWRRADADRIEITVDSGERPLIPGWFADTNIVCLSHLPSEVREHIKIV